MKTKHEIQQAVGAWPDDDDTEPCLTGLAVLRPGDPDLGQSQDELSERYEFIGWYLSQDFKALAWIPDPEPWDGLVMAGLGAADSEHSAFNTHDFQKRLRPVNRFDQAMAIILDRVRDLAIRHSVVSFEDSRRIVERKFENLLRREFGQRLEDLAIKLHQVDQDGRAEVRAGIRRIQKAVFECLVTWRREAFSP